MKQHPKLKTSLKHHREKEPKLKSVIKQHPKLKKMKKPKLKVMKHFIKPALYLMAETSPA